jgi:hypothetical protein
MPPIPYPAPSRFSMGKQVCQRHSGRGPEPDHRPAIPDGISHKPQSYPPCSRTIRVSGMLSNTAERNPSAKTLTTLAGGSDSTDISDAHHTSETRNRLPLRDLLNSCQWVLRKKAPTRIAATSPQTRAPPPHRHRHAGHPGAKLHQSTSWWLSYRLARCPRLPHY